jgi:hypothetical protein
MTRDEYIQTEVMQKCWHEWVDVEDDWPECALCKCRKYHVPDNPNFSTSPADILELQQFVLRAEWWKLFGSFAFSRWWKEVGESEVWNDGSNGYAKWLFSDASRFADLVAQYRGYTPEKEG